MPAGYFEAETAIIDRLRQMAPQLAMTEAVSGEISPDDALARPAALLTLKGHQPMGRASSKSLIRQHWQVTLLTGCANDPQGADARAQAGPLISQIISALEGWTPIAGCSPMALEPGGRVESKDGYWLFHTQFTTFLIIENA